MCVVLTANGAANAPLYVDTTVKKCAIVLSEELPPGTAANAASVLGVSMGRHHPEMVGHDLTDASGGFRHGITTMAIPILKARPEVIKEMRARLQQFEPDLLVVEVIAATRTTRSYDEYAAAFETTPVGEIEYYGLALFGDKKTVNKFTGGLALMR